MIRFRRLLIGLSLVGLAGCHQPDAQTPEPFSVVAPANLGKTVPHPENNPFTREGVLLGRKLFYDPILSGNNKISCATCHDQKKAFSDGVALATHGASGKELHRSAPALQNLAWMKGWFWDGGAKNLESLKFGPIRHEDEMGQDMTQLLPELQNHPQYPALFKSAFGSDTVSYVNIAKALSQFQRTLISANSRYDKYIRNEGGALNSEELEGLTLFRQKCGSCHTTDFFTDFAYHNNGLDNTFSDDFEALAWGRGRITGKPEDIGKYKTPTLRNIAFTAPYMHDGRFNSLNDVLEHYRTGVKNSASLDPVLKQNTTPGITLTETEKTQIIQFLETLSDPDFTHNPDFSAPN